MRIMTTKQAADRLGVSRQQVHRLFATGRLAGQWIGKVLTFRVDSVEEYADKRYKRPAKVSTEVKEQLALELLNGQPIGEIADQIRAEVRLDSEAKRGGLS